MDDAEVQSQIIMVVEFLKELAVNYTNPDLGVVTTDHITFAYIYFSNQSNVV